MSDHGAAWKSKRKSATVCYAALAQAEGKVVDFYELLNVWSRNPASYIPVYSYSVFHLDSCFQAFCIVPVFTLQTIPLHSRLAPVREQGNFTLHHRDDYANRTQHQSNPMTVAQIDDDASMEEIKSAYRYLAKQCHPDFLGDEGHDLCILLNEVSLRD